MILAMAAKTADAASKKSVTALSFFIWIAPYDKAQAGLGYKKLCAQKYFIHALAGAIFPMWPVLVRDRATRDKEYPDGNSTLRVALVSATL